MWRPLLLLPLLYSLLPAQTADRDQRWQGDLDALVTRITTLHPNPYTRTTPDMFRQEVQTLRERIPTLTDAQVVLGLARILGLLNDGHSSISLTQAGTGLRRYPVAFRWFSDGLFITIAPESKATAVGAKVLAINGKPIEEVFNAISPWISYDTENWRKYQSQGILAVHDILVAAGVVEDGAPLRLDLLSRTQQAISVEIGLGAEATAEGPTVSRFALPLSRRQPNQDYWFDWLPEHKTIYVQYNRCRENALLSISAFAADLIAFARENEPNRWIIDVRDNSGGASRWFTELMGTLGAAYASGAMPYPSRGAIGIIGKRTFSSGSLAVRDMQLAGMTLVGETTGGRVFWFGENTPFVLPNSRLTVTVSTRTVGNPETGPAVTPDIPVDFTGADYFANRDPYLEAALSATVP